MGVFANFGAQLNPAGDELVLADVPLTPGNALPVTVSMATIQVAGSQPVLFKNAAIGGDFSTNPWQRGTTFATIADTLTYTADRFFAVGAVGSSITVSRQQNLSVPGTDQALRVQRAAANTSVAPIRVGQVLTSQSSRRLQGRWVCLSFKARSGANFSAVGGAVSVVIGSGTGDDQSAANFVAGSWTGFQSLPVQDASYGTRDVFGTSGGNPSGITAGPILTPNSVVTINSAMRSYQVVALVPANSTQLGFTISYTPAGTAGANDWFELMDVQLEMTSAAAPFASVFERRHPAIELALCQRFFWRLNEPATAAAVVANGMVSATNAQTVAIPAPVTMRIAPTVTAVAGSFRFNIAGTLTAVAGFAGGAAATQSPTCINVVGTVAATAGQATQLVSGASGFGGSVSANAEL